MYIAKSVVSREYNKVAAAKRLWNKHVKKGSELQKEMQLFCALNERKFSNEQIAYDLMRQVKKACAALKPQRLGQEKTAFIREANQTFCNEGFFDHQIKDYADLASIQILLNYCSSGALKEGVINPAITELEDRILKHMTKKSEAANPSMTDLNEILELKESDVDCLVVNLMKEKMDKKFVPRLTEDQQTIVQQFVFENSQENLKQTLEKLRDETTQLISEELKSNKKHTKVEKDKLLEIASLLKEDYHDVSSVDDTHVTFYMTVSKLNDELKE